MKNARSYWPHLTAILAFILLGFAYCPQVLEGKVINQSDISSWKGAANEMVQYQERTGEQTHWTNSMFGGMPGMMIASQYDGNFLEGIYQALFVGPRPVSYLILAMVGFYLLLIAMGVSPWLSFAGAIAYTFCSYNLQILQVGHNAKMVAIALMPWVLASLAVAFRKNNWMGAILFGITLAFQILANHVQITFYLAFIVLFWIIAEGFLAVKGKLVPKFLKTCAMLLLGGVLAIGSNLNHLLPTWEYAKYTMRGGSELNQGGEAQTKGGLKKDYATDWSYGIDESVNLLIPDYKGGASSGALGDDSETLAALRSNGVADAGQIVKQMPLYWGPQPFTAGPMYMGALSVFLFVLAAFLLKGPFKWSMLGLTLLALLLAWGKHFMPLSSFFLDYVPLYNKFRAVSMILVILQVVLPLLGFVALQKVFSGELDKKKAWSALKWATGIVGGVCAFIWIFPSVSGDFQSANDAQIFPEWLLPAIASDRMSLLRGDALRSLLIVLASAGIIGLFLFQKIKVVYAGLLLVLVATIDLMPVGKRYLNESHFMSERKFNGVFEKRPVDELILKDTDPDYRVIDFTVNIFNDSHVSYFHKTVGGYSAAKLQRYQDLIEQHITPELQTLSQDLQKVTSIDQIAGIMQKCTVINMLNTRYFITGAANPPLRNPAANGNAWFVSDRKLVDSPDQEIASLTGLNTSVTAIIDQKYEANKSLLNASLTRDTAARIVLTQYEPNRLKYKSNSGTQQLAVFSEIYYPKGWYASIDGKPLELGRVNYMLRAAVIPAGNHEIEMWFDLPVIRQSRRMAQASSGLLILLLVSGIGYSVYRRQKQKV